MDDSRTLSSIVSTSEIALPADLVEAARDFARASHARRTQETYARWWGDFTSWCAAKGISALPAAAETIAVWMSALAVGEHGRKPLARASINQALSAVIFYHRNAGYPFDRKHPVIARTWAGISRIKAATETVRKAKPLLASDLRDLIEQLRPDVPIEARDATLLSLGWAGALRRTELVGLDWHQLGAGTGFLMIDERGIVVTLMTSKASQDAFVESFIGRLRDECLNETLFSSLTEARVVLETWRADYNGVRPHSALANRTPQEYRAQHIAVAASAGNGQNFTPGLYS
jgi:integrase